MVPESQKHTKIESEPVRRTLPIIKLIQIYLLLMPFRLFSLQECKSVDGSSLRLLSAIAAERPEHDRLKPSKPCRVHSIYLQSHKKKLFQSDDVSKAMLQVWDHTS